MYASSFRLHKLESAVGSVPPSLERLGGGGEAQYGLLHSAAWLAGRVAALQPAQLDSAEQRLARLLPAMDALKAAAPPYDPSRDQKASSEFIS